MSNNISTVTIKHQVVIPKSVRQVIAVKAGDKVLMQALGDLIVVKPINKKMGWAASMRGLGKDLWQNIDPLTYVRKERSAWLK